MSSAASLALGATMRWDELTDAIGWVDAGADPVVTQYPGLDLEVRQPGKYARKSRGADFAVCVGGDWNPAFRDMFHLASDAHSRGLGGDLVNDLLVVLYEESCPIDVAAESGRARTTLDVGRRRPDWPTALAIFQTIGLCEERRYRSLPRGGGRFLPFHFARLVARGWATVNEAQDYQLGGLVSPEDESRAGGLGRLERHLERVVPRAQRWRQTPTRRRPDLWGT